jgi:hypothetical protein
MTEIIFGLTLAYVAVAALLLNLNLATSWPVWVKGTAIVLVTGLYAGVWYGYRGLQGWATPEPLPEEFRIHWITLDDHDKETGEPGAIYFWVREIDEAGLPIGAPRAHKIPWDEASAEAAEEALAQMDEGELLNGRLSRGTLEEAEIAEGADYAGDSSISGDGGVRPAFEFSRVPLPALPPKAVPGAELR